MSDSSTACSKPLIICQELFDDNSQPTDEEIKEYAVNIGIDPESEEHLLHLARDGLMRPLPDGWEPHRFDENRFCYYHSKTKRYQWEHPLDEVYRNLVKKVRTESISSTGEEESKTSAKEDLKSFEEVTLPSEMLPKPLEPVKSLNAGGGVVKKGNLQLAPLRKSPSRTETPSFLPVPDGRDLKISSATVRRDGDLSKSRIDLNLRRSTSNNELGTNREHPPLVSRSSNESLPTRSPSRIDINNLTKFETVKKKEPTLSMQEKHPRSIYGHKELTLTGGGSMFLKSKQRKMEEMTLDLGKSLDMTLNPSTESGVKMVEIQSSDSKDTPKGILREPVITPKQLWDVNPRDMSVEEKQLWKKQELEDERKSVRFNLEKDLNIRFNVSDSEEKDDDLYSEDQDTDEERVIAGVKVSDILNKMEDSDEEPVRQALEETETLIGLSSGLHTDNNASKVHHSEPAKDTRIITDKLKGLYLNNEKIILDFNLPQKSVSPSKLMSSASGTGPGPDVSVSQDIVPSSVQNAKWVAGSEGKDGTNHVNNKLEHVEETKEQVQKDPVKITEKRQLGSSLFRNDIITKSVEDIVLNGDLDKTSLGFEINDSKVKVFDTSQGEKAQEVEQHLKDMKLESERKIKELRERLKEEETLEKNRLTLQLQERMVDFESSLRVQQEARETAAKNTMLLAQEKLDSEFETQLKTAREEFEHQFAEEKKRLESDCKIKIQDLKKDIAEMTARMEKEKIKEIKSIETELLMKNKEELEALKAKLMGEMEAKRSELVKRHKQDLEGLETQLKDSLSTEQTLKLYDLQKAVSEKVEEQEIILEKVQAEHKDALEKLKEDHSKLVESLSLEQAALLDSLREDYQKEIESLKKEHIELVEKLQLENKTQLDEIRTEFKNSESLLREEQEEITERLRSDHVLRLEALRNDYQRDEEVVRREHLERLTELKARLESERQRLKSYSDEKEASGLVFEKLRCEKRLLEDKYRTLKDKYVRLKGDVKMSVERRRKREGANTTGSETERSTSHKITDRSPVEPVRLPKNDNEKVQRKRALDNNNGASNKTATSPKNLTSQLPSEEGLPGVDSDNVSSSSSVMVAKPIEHHRKRRQLFGRFKSASTTRINNNANNNVDLAEANCSPVENLRRQLQKLDDLEDQFPAATHTDTYLRYPFSNPGQLGSSELEFFRHRIHLERDSVRHAKEFLQIQRKDFRNRQRELKQRQMDSSTNARTMLGHLSTEERELTDMEVSLHRTRGLLGEKIIRLRHLEQSLHRATTPKVAGDDAATLSDISSHSAGSSGFSSTDLPSDLNHGALGTPTPPGSANGMGHYQESTEIIRSLENLNTEIHEIWEVLNKQRPTIIPPPPFVYPNWSLLPSTRVPIPSYHGQFSAPAAVGARFAGVGVGVGQGDPSIVERTKSLRDWLRQARIDSAELTSPGQATL